MTNGALARRWCNRLTPEGLGITQIVVPSQLRLKLLRIAHDVPASGHLGTQKAFNRLATLVGLRHFWKPGVHKSVREYCRSCEMCHMLGKGSIQLRAPLISLPVIDEPFRRLAMEIVGVCEKSRNRFILTIINLVKHFPFITRYETIPQVMCLNV